MAENCVIFYKIPQIGCNQQTADVPSSMLTLEQGSSEVHLYFGIQGFFVCVCVVHRTHVTQRCTKSYIFFIRSEYVRLDGWNFYFINEMQLTCTTNIHTHTLRPTPQQGQKCYKKSACVWGSLEVSECVLVGGTEESQKSADADGCHWCLSV